MHGVTAYLRGNGEYLVSVEQGYCANQDTLIRWTPDASVPGIPTNFSYTGYTSTSASLGWTAVAGATGYTLERQEQSTTSPIGWGKWRVLDGRIPAAGTSYTDNGLTPGTRYAYRLRALNAHGASDYTKTVLLERIALPFTDHFTGSVLTSPWSIINGNWTEANGILRQSSTVADSTGRLAFIGNDGTTYPSDYMIAVKVQVTSSTGGMSNVGVGVHLNSGGAGYGLYFNGAPATANLSLERHLQFRREQLLLPLYRGHLVLVQDAGEGADSVRKSLARRHAGTCQLAPVTNRMALLSRRPAGAHGRGLCAGWRLLDRLLRGCQRDG